MALQNINQYFKIFLNQNSIMFKMVIQADTYKISTLYLAQTNQIQNKMIPSDQNNQVNPPIDLMVINPSTLAINPTSILSIKSDIEQNVSLQTLAGNHMHSECLKVIYLTLVRLGYAVFLIGLAISLTTDAQTRQNFINYLGRRYCIALLILITVLAVVSNSLNKAFQPNTHYAPSTKRMLNFIQDIILGFIYTILMIIVGIFITENSQESRLIVAFILFVTGFGVFVVKFLIKWIYYLCLQGKNNYEAWLTVPPPVIVTGLNQQQLNSIAGFINQTIKITQTNMPIQTSTLLPTFQPNYTLSNIIQPSAIQPNSTQPASNLVNPTLASNNPFPINFNFPTSQRSLRNL